MRAPFTKNAEREEKRRQQLEEFTAIHRSETPPIELQQSCPRKIRWRSTAKILLKLEVSILIALLLTFGAWFVPKDAREHQKLRRMHEQIRHETENVKSADQSKNAEERKRWAQEREQNLRMTEMEVLRQVLAVCASLLLYFAISWAALVRPFGVLPRYGTCARGVVTGRRRGYGKWRTIEYAFTTDTGELMRNSWGTSKAVHDTLKDGQPVWILYLPRKPKRATVYGMNGFAEVVAD